MEADYHRLFDQNANGALYGLYERGKVVYLPMTEGVQFVNQMFPCSACGKYLFTTSVNGEHWGVMCSTRDCRPKETLGIDEKTEREAKGKYNRRRRDGKHLGEER